MWKPSETSVQSWISGKVVPKRVLYSYDEPLIFTAQIGLTEFLFYKIEEEGDANLFLAVQITSSVLEALAENSLSLIGALRSGESWIIELGSGYDVRSYWKKSVSEVPVHLLPEPGLALAPSKSSTANTIEQSKGFLSAKYEGVDFAGRSLPLSQFRHLVNSTHDAFRKIFPAPVLDGYSFARGLDFGVLQPRFSSLILAIDRPYVDFRRIKERKLTKEELASIADKFDKDRKEFFDQLSTLVDEATKGDIKKSSAVHHFTTLDQVNEVVPTSHNSIDYVEFRSPEKTLRPVSINNELGDRLWHAYRVAETAPRKLTGTIVEINAASGTIVLLTDSARQVTCIVERSVFRELGTSLGRRIRVKGKFKKRTRRDRLHVQDLEHLPG